MAEFIDPGIHGAFKIEGDDAYYSRAQSGLIRYPTDDIMDRLSSASNFGGSVSSIPTLTKEQVGQLAYALQQAGKGRYANFRNDTGIDPIQVSNTVPVGGASGRDVLDPNSGSPGIPKTKIVNGVRVDIDTGQPYVSQPTASSGQPYGQGGFQESSISSPTPSAQIPTGSLQPGMSGPEVLKLQNYLVSQGLMTQAELNTGPGIYGPKTTAAVKALQERLGVDNSTGVGYFGPRTISAIQASAPQGGGFSGSGGNALPGSSGGQGGVMEGDFVPGAGTFLPDGTYSSGGSQGGNSASAGGPTSTGVPQLDELLGTLQTYLDGIVAAGNKINPNIEISPETLKQFLAQAEQEINPYYKSTINAIRDDVQKNLGVLQKQYELDKKGTEAQLRDTLATTRESAAGAGTIFSGARGAGERDLGSLYNRKFEEQALGLESSIGGTLRDTERTIGSRNISSLIPSFSSASASTEGKGSVIGGRTLSFQPTGGITGSLERENLTAIEQRRNELESAERSRRALNFYS